MGAPSTPLNVTSSKHRSPVGRSLLLKSMNKSDCSSLAGIPSPSVSLKPNTTPLSDDMSRLNDDVAGSISALGVTTA